MPQPRRFARRRKHGARMARSPCDVKSPLNAFVQAMRSCRPHESCRTHTRCGANTSGRTRAADRGAGGTTGNGPASVRREVRSIVHNADERGDVRRDGRTSRIRIDDELRRFLQLRVDPHVVVATRSALRGEG